MMYEIRLADKGLLNMLERRFKGTELEGYLGGPGTLLLTAYDGTDFAGLAELQFMESVSYVMLGNGYEEKANEVIRALLEAVENIAFRRVLVQNADMFNRTLLFDLGYRELSGANTFVKRLKGTREFKTYAEFEAFMAGQPQRVYSLDHFKACMHEVFDFQNGVTCVHVGGTNGKGSTVNYMYEVLSQAGYRVGTFTSPPMTSRLDIIRVAGTPISERVITTIASRYLELWLKYELSMFEIEVFIALVYFLYQGIDLAIFEVGLGGTLDATNIIHPILAINTNIGLDHVDYLGHTYASIAENKAGIVKKYVPYLTGETRGECLEVFRRVCKEHQSRLLQVVMPENVVYDDYITFTWKGERYAIDTKAKYQVKNAALALTALGCIKTKFPVDVEDAQLGMYKAHWAGRFETIHEDPLIVIDGAHNKEGMEAFFETAREYGDVAVIYSAFRDKAIHEMIGILKELTDDITVTTFDHRRAASVEELRDNLDVKTDPSWQHAVDEALKGTKTTFVTGSLALISLVRAYVRGKEQTKQSEDGE